MEAATSQEARRSMWCHGTVPQSVNLAIVHVNSYTVIMLNDYNVLTVGAFGDMYRFIRSLSEKSADSAAIAIAIAAISRP